LEIAYLGGCHLEKYPWEIAAMENAFGKEPGLRSFVNINIFVMKYYFFQFDYIFHFFRIS